MHNSTVDSWADYAAESTINEFLIVGGFESGIDAAVNLVKRGWSVTVLNRGHPWACSSAVWRDGGVRVLESILQAVFDRMPY